MTKEAQLQELIYDTVEEEVIKLAYVQEMEKISSLRGAPRTIRKEAPEVAKRVAKAVSDFYGKTKGATINAVNATGDAFNRGYTSTKGAIEDLGTSAYVHGDDALNAIKNVDKKKIGYGVAGAVGAAGTGALLQSLATREKK